eukprot:gene405-15874_t
MADASPSHEDGDGKKKSRSFNNRKSKIVRKTENAPPSAFDNLMKVVTDSPTTSRRSSAHSRTGSPAPMSGGFRSTSNDVVLTTLPILSKEKNAAKRKELLLSKLDLCCHIFDFSQTAHTSDPVQTAKSKQAKTSALNDLVKFTTGKAEFMAPDVFPSYIKMISANLFRPLAPPDDPKAAPYDPEDDEPRLEPGWPHIELVYALLIRIAEHKSLSVDVALQSLTMLLAYSFGTFFFGVAEVLEFLGCIINGFAMPLKEEHRSTLVDVFLPLHRHKSMAVYHPQLAYCVSQFLSKAPDLVAHALKYLFKYWPKSAAQKQVHLLNQVEGIVGVIEDQEFNDVAPLVFAKLGKCIENTHFMVSERALAVWNQEHMLDRMREVPDDLYHLVGPSIYRNSKRHWSGVVHDSNDRALQALRDVSEEHFEEHCSEDVVSAGEEQAAALSAREEKWATIQAMAQKNAAARGIAVQATMPTIPTACPDIFMKGENISPLRQANRLHRRKSVLESFIRRKSILPQAEEVKAALEEYQQHDLENAAPAKGLQRVVSGRHGFASTHDDDDANRASGGGDGDADGGFTGFDGTDEISADAVVSGDVDWSPPGSSASADGPSTAGCYLVKRKAGTFGRSRRRWFAIDAPNSRIVYHVEKPGDSSQEPRGFIPIDKGVSVSVAGKQLILKTPKRTFSLAATTSIVPQEWEQTLTKIIEAPPPSISGNALGTSISPSTSASLLNFEGGGQSNEAWDVGVMKKAAVEKAVVAANNGDFLVRRIKTGGKAVVCINDGGNAQNFTIECNARGKLEYGGKEHENVTSVLEFMRADPPTSSGGKKLWLMDAASLTPPEEQSTSIKRDARQGSSYGFEVDNEAETLEI